MEQRAKTARLLGAFRRLGEGDKDVALAAAQAIAGTLRERVGFAAPDRSAPVSAARPRTPARGSR